MNIEAVEICVLYTMIQKVSGLNMRCASATPMYIYEKKIRNGGAFRVGALFVVADKSSYS